MGAATQRLRRTRCDATAGRRRDSATCRLQRGGWGVQKGGAQAAGAGIARGLEGRAWRAAGHPSPVY